MSSSLDMVCVSVNSVPEPAVLLFCIHCGGHRACGCIVLNVVLVRHSVRVVKRLLDIQTILIAGDNKAVKVQQIAGFAVIAFFRLRSDGEIIAVLAGHSGRERKVSLCFAIAP